jgi:hypothetical protein
LSEHIDDKAINALALAVVEQAVADWRYLCNDGIKKADCNFEELTHFFKHDCDSFLVGTDILAEDILKQLLTEKARAKREVSA